MESDLTNSPEHKRLQQYSFVVPGQPVAQPRPRFSTKSGRAYTPDNGVREFKDEIVLRWKQQRRPKIEAGRPILLGVHALLPRPKSSKGESRKWHVTRPDFDNITKAVMDALNGHAWHDDSQVCYSLISKRVCSVHDKPMTEILIRELCDGVILQRGYPWELHPGSGTEEHSWRVVGL